MTLELATLNFETHSLPGLRVWGWSPRGQVERFEVIVQNEHGAIALWSEPNTERARRLFGEESYGGVAIHSPKPLFDFAPDPADERCEILGGECWTDGSFLAYTKTFLPLIRKHDTAGILRELAEWHHDRFGSLSVSVTEEKR
ncbi:hypothetical protein ABZ215_24845 [Amycolatopsis sp. NPDC006131]|uniref:hypothetical protein n=1 Tax=Amycolatopsis sp. NPDC006131 TaxID=3156731 RepID=UPI0033B97656